MTIGREGVPEELLLSVFVEQSRRTIKFLKAQIARLEMQLPGPKLRVRSGTGEFRFDQQTPELAVFLKLCRCVSLLSAHVILVEEGLIQEQGILQRAMDETDEDILFLALGIERGFDPLHHEYLKAFWAEEFDPECKPITSSKRAMIPRKKIRAYINAKLGHSDLARVNDLGRTIHSTYSGFVHGAAPHLMDLFDPHERHFRVDGLKGTATHDSYIIDATNYPYRVTMSLAVVALSLGREPVAVASRMHLAHLEKWLRLFE